MKEALPSEGDDNYEKWREKWPVLFEYNFDIANYGDPKCFYTMYNAVKNNAVISATLYNGAADESNLDLENNRIYERSENTYFADPTHGDYTIVKDKGDFSLSFDFDAVGRQ